MGLCNSDGRGKRKYHEEQNCREILEGVKNYPRITQKKLMEKTGLSWLGIKWNILKLKEEGKIKHIGPAKGSYLELMSTSIG